MLQSTECLIIISLHTKSLIHTEIRYFPKKVEFPFSAGDYVSLMLILSPLKHQSILQQTIFEKYVFFIYFLRIRLPIKFAV